AALAAHGDGEPEGEMVGAGQRGGDLCRAGLVLVRDDHRLGALRDAPAGQRAADAPRASRDDGHGALQRAHQVPPGSGRDGPDTVMDTEARPRSRSNFALGVQYKAFAQCTGTVSSALFRRSQARRSLHRTGLSALFRNYQHWMCEVSGLSPWDKTLRPWPLS